MEKAAVLRSRSSIIFQFLLISNESGNVAEFVNSVVESLWGLTKNHRGTSDI
jgi:hypothetical protein